MSVLRKKLDVKRDLPDHIKNSVTLWEPLHNALCGGFSELTKSTWEVGLAEVKVGMLSELLSDLSQKGLYYGYGGEESGLTFMTYYDVDFASLVTHSSLDIEGAAPDGSYEPSKLDLLLFKSVAKSVNIEFWNLFKDIYQGIYKDIYRDPNDPLTEIESGFSPDDISLSSDKAMWSEVILHIRPVQTEDEKTKETPKKTSKAKAKTKTEDVKTASLALRVLLPQNLILQILATRGSEAQAPVIDPDNPWTRHMRNSLDTAIVPVRAVVETCRMTVADCTRFEIGQVIELPGVSLQSIGLEAEMSNSSVNFASAALGIFKSHRAVKLIENMDSEFCSDSIAL